MIDSRCKVYYRASLPPIYADTQIDSSSDGNGPGGEVDGGHGVDGSDTHEAGEHGVSLALSSGQENPWTDMTPTEDYDMDVELDAVEIFTNLCRDQGVEV